MLIKGFVAVLFSGISTALPMIYRTPQEPNPFCYMNTTSIANGQLNVHSQGCSTMNYPLNKTHCRISSQVVPCYSTLSSEDVIMATSHECALSIGGIDAPMSCDVYNHAVPVGIPQDCGWNITETYGDYAYVLNHGC